VPGKAQTEIRDANGEVEADLTAYRNWLQRHSPVGSTDQYIGAKTCNKRCFPARTDVIASEETRPATVSVNTAQTISPPPVAPRSSPNLLIVPS
jgi:hypothetical protein